jgi:hypothetical protein
MKMAAKRFALCYVASLSTVDKAGAASRIIAGIIEWHRK